MSKFRLADSLNSQKHKTLPPNVHFQPRTSSLAVLEKSTNMIEGTIGFVRATCPPHARKVGEEDILCVMQSSQASILPRNMMIDASVNTEKNIVYIFQPKYLAAVPLVFNQNKGYWLYTPGYTNILTMSDTDKLVLSKTERKNKKASIWPLKLRTKNFRCT